MRVYLLTALSLITISCKNQVDKELTNKELPVKITSGSYVTSLEYDAQDRLAKLDKGTTYYLIEYSNDSKVSKVSRELKGQYIDLVYSNNEVIGNLYVYDSNSNKFYSKPGVIFHLTVDAKGQLVKITREAANSNTTLQYDVNRNLTGAKAFIVNYSRAILFKGFDSRNNPYKDIPQYQLIYFLIGCMEGAYDGDAWEESQFLNNPSYMGFAFSVNSDTLWQKIINEYNSKDYVIKRTYHDVFGNARVVYNYTYK
ncbi:hypothetical protein [Spirosoma gilvum]